MALSTTAVDVLFSIIIKKHMAHTYYSTTPAPLPPKKKCEYKKQNSTPRTERVMLKLNWVVVAFAHQTFIGICFVDICVYLSAREQRLWAHVHIRTGTSESIGI